MVRNFPVIIVTGGSSGIGKSFVTHIGKLHPTAFFCNLSRTAPVGLSPELKLRHIPCDLAESAQVDHALDALRSILKEEAPSGPILLINNSGFGAYGRFPDPSTERQLSLIDVNIRAVVHLTAGLLPLLRARGGAIVNLASVAAFQPTSFLATYGASKAFILHWSLGLREELRGCGIRVLAVCPGPTRTAFFQEAGFGGEFPDSSGGLTPDEVVMQSLQALAADKGQVVTGWRNRIMVAVSARLPKPVAARIGAALLARTRLKDIES